MCCRTEVVATSRLRRLQPGRAALAPLRALSMCVAKSTRAAMVQDRPPRPAVPEDLSSLVVTMRTGSIAPDGMRLDVDVSLAEEFPAKPGLHRDLLARWGEHAAARRASMRSVDAPATSPDWVSSCDVARPVPRCACKTIGGVSRPLRMRNAGGRAAMGGRTHVDGVRARAQVAGMRFEGVHIEGVHVEGRPFEGMRFNGIRFHPMGFNRMSYDRTLADHGPPDRGHPVAVRVHCVRMPWVMTPVTRPPGHRVHPSIFFPHPRAMRRARTAP